MQNNKMGKNILYAFILIHEGYSSILKNNWIYLNYIMLLVIKN